MRMKRLACVLIPALALASVRTSSAELLWTVTQLTSFPATQDAQSGAIDPDINDSGEIVYVFPHNHSTVGGQIYSLTSGQLTFPSEWPYASDPHINNLGEILFVGGRSVGNPCVCRLDGTAVNVGPEVFAPNDLDHNDLGEVVAMGPAHDPFPDGIYSDYPPAFVPG